MHDELYIRLNAAHLVLTGLLQQSPAIMTLPEFKQMEVRRKAYNLAQAKGVDSIPALCAYINSIVEIDDAIVDMSQMELKALELAFMQETMVQLQQKEIDKNGYNPF